MNLVALVCLVVFSVDVVELQTGLSRMPPPEVTAANLAFNVSCRLRLARELEVVPWDSTQAEWLSMTDREHYQLWWLWDCLAYGHRGDLFWLSRLREGIGPDAYREGLMPPHVPLWRFHRID